MQTHKIRHWRPKSFHHWLLGMVFLSCIAGAGSASAQWAATTLTIDDAPESIDGEYTVTATQEWSCDFMEIFLCHENSIALYERANGGDWHLIASHEPSDRPDWPDELITELSVALKRDNGTYDYRVYSVIYWWNRDSFTGAVTWNISDSETSVPKTIIVNKPEKPKKPTINTFPSNNRDVDGVYTIGWNKPSGDITYYILQEKKDSKGWNTVQGKSAGLTRSFTTSGSPREDGHSYSYQVSACNDRECGDFSDVVVVHVPLNNPPTVELHSPSKRVPAAPGEIFTLRATATDSNGIAEVVFYGNGNRLGEGRAVDKQECISTHNCYRYNWTTPANEGPVTITVKAKDTLGAVSGSAGGIIVDIEENQPPLVLLQSLPGNITDHDSLTLKASASDSDGSIAWVEFFENGSSLGRLSSPPYEKTWSPGAAGNYDIHVEAADNEDALASSQTQRVVVEALQPPSPPTQLKIDDQLAPIPDNITGFYTVSWNPVAGADDYQLQQLQEGVDTQFKDIATPDGVTSAYLPNQSQGHYRYRVAACNAAGCGDFSGEIALSVVLSAPQAPSGLSAVPARAGYDFTGAHTLSWESVTSEPKPKYYRLEEKTGGVDSPAEWQALTNSLTTELTLKDKAPGTYSYQVRACNAFDCSAEGEVVTFNVQPPNLLTADPVADDANCNGHCLKIQGTGIDPDSAFTLTDLQTGGRELLSPAAITWRPPVRVGAEEELDPATYAWLPLSVAMQNALDNKEGVHVSVQNANGERAGIDAYGNETVERLSQIDSAPAVAVDGTIYVGSGNNVYALNPEDGTVISGWPYATGDLVKATPVVDSVNDNIYVGSLDDNLYALTPLGLEQWRLKTGGDLVASAVLDENRILYQGSMDGVLYAVQAQNGAIQWTYPAGAGIAETPVLAGNGTLYFTTVDSSQVYALGRGILGPDQLAWESSDDSLLKEKLEELDWQPGEQHLPEYQTAARLYRLLLQPPLNLSRDVLTFWTYALVNRASV
ncbi:Ig-like domain-containing protein, partial [Microbulbifer rhizosphaerae]